MKNFQLNPVLLELLNSSMPYLSGELIAQKLGISRAAVHKKIEKLRQEGYIIQAYKGFSLVEPLPHQLIAEKIQTLLPSFQPTILFTPECTSTNTLAKELLANQQEPFILITRSQYSGRGRMNRTWQMQADHDIAFSFAVPCFIDKKFLFSIIRLASLAIHQALSLYSQDLLIKWPNDIINKQGQKICGILTESILEDNHVRYLIIGVGINVNSQNLPEYATSLYQMTGEITPINQLFSEIITNISELWKDFPDNVTQIIQQWEENIAWINQEIMITYHDQIHKGKLKSVTEDGSLIVLIDNQEKTFLAGDLSLLKMRKQIEK